MEILDPDLWNDDGTPKKPSPEYMQRLGEHSPFLDYATRLNEVTAQTREVESSDKPIVQGGQHPDPGFVSYARLRTAAREQRAPEVGDIVHLWDEEGAVCRAAIVMETESFNHNAELRAHIPRKPYEDHYAVHDEAKEGAGEGTWHWPCGEGQ